MTCRKSGRIDFKHAADVRRSAAGMDHVGAAVVLRNHARHARQQRGSQLPRGGHAIEELRLIEANHLDNGVDQFARSIQGKPVSRACDVVDVEIETRGAQGQRQETHRRPESHLIRLQPLAHANACRTRKR
ncbi:MULTISPECIES: hypothetical protein [unclassified Mesorhizobium]|uniref:hypothetical protein n=1 Tax=unclassified Mesorhizobium TaxID=325217 RepID=UPI001FE07061|nr:MULTISPECIES: hypothetical protein [unclassified Mesorhizobium]